MSVGPLKKHTWNNNNNNKLGKRQSCQNLSFPRESCNSSDSGFSSRSPTPNKHYKGGSQTESSDERDSIPPVTQSKYKYVSCIIAESIYHYILKSAIL